MIEMRIDRERGCLRISFESNTELAVLQNKINTCAERVDGLMSSGELLREGEGYVFCIRHRESLKAYLEHAIFDLDQFILILGKLQQLLECLHSNHLSVYDCIWDIDCIFVGNNIEDLEFVYLPGISTPAENGRMKAPCRFSDMLAVLSLRVYESQVPALQTLSDVIGIFSQWENEYLLKGEYISAPFLTSRRLLAPYCKEQNSFMRGVRKALDVIRNSKEENPTTSKPVVRPSVMEIGKSARLCLEGIGLLKGRKIVLQGNIDMREGESLCIGRNTAWTPMLLPYPIVSRNQATISYQNGTWFLTDLGSANSTFLDDIPINPGVGYPLIRGHIFFFAHRDIGYRVKKV